MIQLTQQADNTFFITTENRKSVSQYYLMKFTSEVNNITYPVFPTILVDNVRALKFQLRVNVNDSDPLQANVALPLTGTYQYSLYIANTQSLTASPLTLIDQGYAFVDEGTCVETPVYTYTSSNDTGTASVYVASTCSIGATISYDLTLSQRVTGVQAYFWRFTSEVTNLQYDVLPSILEENDRFVNLSCANVTPNTPDPLAAEVSIPLAGYYTLQTFISSIASLTASRTLLDTRTIQIIDDCENTVFTYTSSNEDATAIAYTGSTCSFTEHVVLDLTLDSRKGSTQSYMFTLTSDLTNISTSLFPSLISSNERYVTLGFTNSNILSPSPLTGIEEITPAGFYVLDTYVADSISLTASKTLLDTRYIQLITCSEDTVYTYISGNEGATASVYLSEVCSDCLIWDITPEYFNLCVTEWQNCT